MRHSTDVCLLAVSLAKTERFVGQWASLEWQVAEVFPVENAHNQKNHIIVPLQLYQDERASYRLNLDLEQPFLYLVCDEDSGGNWIPKMVSADQSAAAGCLESDTPVLSFPMPAAVACWIESFITRYGEVKISMHRRKHVDRRKEVSKEQGLKLR